jgi:WD40 repeat protein
MPDDKRIVSCAFDHTLRIWDAASGKLALTLRGHDGAVGSAAVSPDGRRIVSGGTDRTVKIWDCGPRD